MIYLDAAATTPVKREVIEARFPWLTNNFGNPSSHHEMGERAAAALENARAKVAAVLHAHPEEIVFTAGGTEADNLIIKGVALARQGENPALSRLIVSAIEHPAVMQAALYLERFHGFTLTLAPVDDLARVDLDALAQLLQKHDDVALVSVMYANNEVGTVQDIAAVAKLCQQHAVPFHSDAVQAAGWLTLNTSELGVNALSLSGHKIGAPKGVGVAFIKSPQPFEPLIHGGGQERGHRSGTENVAFSVAFATALELAEASRAENFERITALRDSLIARVLAENPNAVLTGHPSSRLPSIASFCFAQSSGESLLLELERDSVLSSSGSACAAGSDEPSDVLTAMGVERELAQTALRFSMGAEITAAQLDVAATSLAAAVVRLGTLGTGNTVGKS